MWLPCHWWRYLDGRSITAMTALLLLLALTALTTYAVAHAWIHDPRRPDLAPPRSHIQDGPPRPWYTGPGPV